ncbi:hypothetical protein BV133_622 [Blastochloris viridis]|uniref:Uncharacterized protein n=1 Tax=Blastochloris viridis TaxID=1079 RepID=A0A182CYC2_BLAVI|nr:hypothetical protein BV133_622 [Blastochloris viridis]
MAGVAGRCFLEWLSAEPCIDRRVFRPLRLIRVACEPERGAGLAGNSVDTA